MKNNHRTCGAVRTVERGGEQEEKEREKEREAKEGTERKETARHEGLGWPASPAGGSDV